MILLITERRTLHVRLSSAFRRAGIPFLSAPVETAAFLCEKEDTGGILIDCVPDPQAGEELCRELRLRYPELPIAAVVEDARLPDLPADRILRNGGTGLCRDAVSFCTDLCGFVPGRLSSYYLSVGTTPSDVLYMGLPLHLSPKEFEILRCLFYRYPEPTSADTLMCLCYPGESRGVSNLASLIRRINRKAREIHPVPLVTRSGTRGYCLRDGI